MKRATNAGTSRQIATVETAPATTASDRTKESTPRTTTAEKEDPATAGTGTRRAQGWRTTGDGNGAGAALGPKRSSIMTTTGSSLARRHSVQFSEDTPTTTPSARPGARGQTHRDDAAFRVTMDDFLGVMYGTNGISGPSTTNGGDSVAPRARASAYRSAVAVPQAQPPSPNAAASSRGPQVRARQATTANAAPISGRGSTLSGAGSGRGGDGIDRLVDHLVRAYSSRRGDSGAFAGEDDGAERPITYDSGRRRGPVTGRRRANDANDVSMFVSNALDGFLGQGSGRGNQLASKQSILSSLGLDQNFADLLSFKTRSNLQNGYGDDDVEESAQLKPLYIGEQAMFRSVTSRPADVSVSKSMSVMRGVIPPAVDDDGSAGAASRGPAVRGGGRNTRAAANMDRSLNSADIRPRGGSPGGRRTVAAAPRGMNEKSFTLDSRALLGGAEGADDSWGDVDAAAAAAAKKEASKGKPSTGSGTPVVAGARSLLELARDRSEVQDLLEQETLNRNVVAALEQQLRGLIVRAVGSGQGASEVRGRRRPNERTTASPGAAAASATSPRGTATNRRTSSTASAGRK